jgi:hypothetical protein
MQSKARQEMLIMKTTKSTRYKAQMKWRGKWQTAGGDDEQSTLASAKNVIKRTKSYTHYVESKWRIVQVDIFETPIENAL